MTTGVAIRGHSAIATSLVLFSRHSLFIDSAEWAQIVDGIISMALFETCTIAFGALAVDGTNTFLTQQQASFHIK